MAGVFTNHVLSGLRVKLVLFRFYTGLLWHIIKRYKSPTKVKARWGEIKDSLEVYRIKKATHKVVKHEGRFFFSCNLPGWPQKNFYNKILSMSETSTPNSLDKLGIVQIGFTKKCPLNCEHCFEGKILNQPEAISLEEHVLMVKKLQDGNVPLIQFGGGEPLNRFDDLISVLKSANNSSDFWIYTSGYGLTQSKALSLKNAGLIGVSVSLDHFDSNAHNVFRRNHKSYQAAMDAIKNAQEAGLLVAMSICVTNEFCSQENLHSYLALANSLKVNFVQLMEPRATGNYEGMDVLLTAKSKEILDQFYLNVNTSKAFQKAAIVQYFGFQQRKSGCAGAANRYIYIDTDGFVQACPFCSNKKSHFLTGNTPQDLIELKAEGCNYVKSVNHEKTFA